MKYFKPKSLTWWGSFGMVITGAIESWGSKSITPTLLAGLTGIGVRGALK
jgi:hypothetical protein